MSPLTARLDQIKKCHASLKTGARLSCAPRRGRSLTHHRCSRCPWTGLITWAPVWGGQWTQSKQTSGQRISTEDPHLGCRKPRLGHWGEESPAQSPDHSTAVCVALKGRNYHRAWWKRKLRLKQVQKPARLWPWKGPAWVYLTPDSVLCISAGCLGPAS